MAPPTAHSTIAGMPVEDTLRKTLAVTIRDGSDTSLRDVSERTGISLGTLSNFRHGRGSLRIDQAETLAEVLGLKLTIRRIKGPG